LISLEGSQILDWHEWVISFEAGRTVMIATAESLALRCISAVIVAGFFIQ